MPLHCKCFLTLRQLNPNHTVMKIKVLFAFLLLSVSSFGLMAQNQEETDPDLKYAADMLKPGTQAPDFTLNDITGAPVKLSDFRGRKVVLQFWASWCPDCRAEIPHIKALQEASDPSKIAFVAVSFDRSEEAFVNYAEKNGLGGVQLYDPAGMRESEISKAYHVGWIPSLYLIDEEGKVVLATVVLDKITDSLQQ